MYINESITICMIRKSRLSAKNCSTFGLVILLGLGMIFFIRSVAYKRSYTY